MTVRFLRHKVPNAEIPDILNQYAVYALPSRFEGMPKTLLEAMSCGLACVGTNVAGTKELITHGETGLLAELNEDSLREQITRLMKDAKLQHELGANARQFIINNYSLNEGIKKEIGVYQETTQTRDHQ